VRYPPIEDYALVGDSRACALISRDGSADWMCLPRFDSPSLFGRILDWDRGGHFLIAPAVPYDVRRRYVDGTNVLETTFRAEGGEAALIDFMPAQTEEAKSRALAPLRALVRLVECRSGRVPMRLEYVPRPLYGTGAAGLSARTRYEVAADRGGHVTHLHSDVALDVSRRDARGRFDVVPGERLRFVMTYSWAEPAVIISDSYTDHVYEQTLRFWRDWASRCTYDGPYRDAVLRSALTLKLLSYAPSGAIVAAPTTSLPEEIGGERNWDYRYCWIRDSAFTVKAMLSLGFYEEAEAFVSWLLHATKLTEPELRPMYTIYGEPRLPERELLHLEGYRCSRPVRSGNGAHRQAQFDVYGELVDAVHALIAITGRKVSGDEAALIRGVADYVMRHWRQPDDGIWEARSGRRHYTHSKVMAWDALEHAAMLVEEGHIDGDAARWRSEAAIIRREVMERGFNARVGAFTHTFEGDTFDAAVLAIPLVGFLRGDDPRMLSTIAAVREQLSVNGFLRRYRGFDDGVSGGEGCFITCNFWLAAALAHGHRIEEAREVFEHTMTAANDVGIFSEEVDPSTGGALGNTPQGLSHISLITAALAIARAERGDVFGDHGPVTAE